MLFNLISFGKKFELEQSLLYQTLNSNVDFIKESDLANFNDKFFKLYQIDIFRPILDVILTKLKNNEAKIKVSPMKSWDRVAGHCTTATTTQKNEESLFFKKNYTIVIKSIRPDIIIHEIAHAIEHIANIDLNKDFRKILASDTNGKKSTNEQLNASVKSILKDELKNYELSHFMSELFARVFEIISISYEVNGWSKYQYKYKEVASFFENTIKWMKNTLHPILLKQTDKNILAESELFTKNLKPYKKKWATESINSNFSANKKWKDNLPSISTTNSNEVAEVINSFEHWTQDKTIHQLDDGKEYFLFNDKGGKRPENKNIKLLEE